ncbi:MAG: hypothetical protein ACYDIE_05695 [Candidatus Krumholzibacteriia bacterium]
MAGGVENQVRRALGNGRAAAAPQKEEGAAVGPPFRVIGLAALEGCGMIVTKPQLPSELSKSFRHNA